MRRIIFSGSMGRGLVTGALIALGTGATALADGFAFSTGNPDGLMAAASRPPAGMAQEIETADDFILTATTAITSATFTGLIAAGTTVDEVVVELYRVFPLDSVDPPSGHVLTRMNSPADNAFESRAFTAGEISFTVDILSDSFTAQNSVLNGINAFPNQHTGGEGPVTGVEVRFNVQFNPAFVLAPGHYFFKPSATGFFWLSAPKPIVAPGTPFLPDLQAWIRNEDLAPDWSRIGTDIVGGNPAPTFNMTFTLAGAGVGLDIRPGSCPNPLNRRSNGVLPVGLVGNGSFDLGSIDVGSIRLCRADGVGSCVAPLAGPPGPHTVFGDVASASDASGCDCQITGPDGITDLVMHFSTQEVVSALELGSLAGGTQVELRITATLTDGSPFISGTDCIVLVPPH